MTTENNKYYIKTWQINQLILKEEIDRILIDEKLSSSRESIFPIFGQELIATKDNENQSQETTFFGKTTNEIKNIFEEKFITPQKKYPQAFVLFFKDEILKKVCLFYFLKIFLT